MKNPYVCFVINPATWVRPVALNPLNSSNLEQLVLKGLISAIHILTLISRVYRKNVKKHRTYQVVVDR